MPEDARAVSSIKRLRRLVKACLNKLVPDLFTTQAEHLTKLLKETQTYEEIGCFADVCVDSALSMNSKSLELFADYILILKYRTPLGLQHWPKDLCDEEEEEDKTTTSPSGAVNCNNIRNPFEIALHRKLLDVRSRLPRILALASQDPNVPCGILLMDRDSVVRRQRLVAGNFYSLCGHLYVRGLLDYNFIATTIDLSAVDTDAEYIEFVCNMLMTTGFSFDQECRDRQADSDNNDNKLSDTLARLSQLTREGNSPAVIRARWLVKTVRKVQSLDWNRPKPQGGAIRNLANIDGRLAKLSKPPRTSTSPTAVARSKATERAPIGQISDSRDIVPAALASESQRRDQGEGESSGQVQESDQDWCDINIASFSNFPPRLGQVSFRHNGTQYGDYILHHEALYELRLRGIDITPMEIYRERSQLVHFQGCNPAKLYLFDPNSPPQHRYLSDEDAQGKDRSQETSAPPATSTSCPHFPTRMPARGIIKNFEKRDYVPYIVVKDYSCDEDEDEGDDDEPCEGRNEKEDSDTEDD